MNQKPEASRIPAMAVWWWRYRSTFAQLGQKLLLVFRSPTNEQEIASLSQVQSYRFLTDLQSVESLRYRMRFGCRSSLKGRGEIGSWARGQTNSKRLKRQIGSMTGCKPRDDHLSTIGSPWPINDWAVFGCSSGTLTGELN